jgi:hypothetical protein
VPTRKVLDFFHLPDRFPNLSPAPQVHQRRSLHRVGGGDGDGVGGGDGDGISGLPEELLLDRLSHFECAHQAARTSVLSHQWCGLWAQLRELRLNKVDADKIEIALTCVRPNLNTLNIRVPEDRDLTGAQRSPRCSMQLIGLLRRNSSCHCIGITALLPLPWSYPAPQALHQSICPPRGTAVRWLQAVSSPRSSTWLLVSIPAGSTWVACFPAAHAYASSA